MSPCMLTHNLMHTHTYTVENTFDGFLLSLASCSSAAPGSESRQRCIVGLAVYLTV